MEGDSAGSGSVSVCGVVDASVVEAAEWDRISQVGGSAVTPGLLVVEFAPGVGALATIRRAGGVTGGQCNPLGFGEQPGGSTQVEREALATEDSGEDPSTAGKAA